MLKITKRTRVYDEIAGSPDTPCGIVLYRKTKEGDILTYGRDPHGGDGVSYRELSFRTIGEALRAGDRYFRDRDGHALPYGLKVTTWGGGEKPFDVHWFGRDLRERQAA